MPERYRTAHRGTGRGKKRQVTKNKQYRTTQRLMSRADDRVTERRMNEFRRNTGL